MKKSLAQSIKDLIKNECQRQGVPYNKSMYRRAKKAAQKVPWNQRHLIGR